MNKFIIILDFLGTKWRTQSNKISLKIIDDFNEYEANEDSIDEGKDSGIYR